MLCASYSGNTEETLACFDAADALGASRVVVTAGGKLAELAREQDVPVIPLPGVFQPRAAVAYMFVSALEVAGHSGVAPGMRAELDAASAHLGALATEWGPDADSDSLAKRIAQRTHGAAPCIYGAGPTGRGRAPLEDAAQRERQAAGLLRRAARGRPQRAGRLGRQPTRSASSSRSSSRTPISIRACDSESS